MFLFIFASQHTIKLENDLMKMKAKQYNFNILNSVNIYRSLYIEYIQGQWILLSKYFGKISASLNKINEITKMLKILLKEL